MKKLRALFFVLTGVLASCAALRDGTPQDVSKELPIGGRAEVVATPWPAANALFYNPDKSLQFKGADVANTVDLGDGRVLWVFGDTLLAEPGRNHCGRFGDFEITVHNSMAIQHGSDPSTAQIRHYWGERDGRPVSFFEPESPSDSWYWMGGVSKVSDQLIVFLMEVRATDPEAKKPADACAGLDFEVLGWDARIATIEPGDPQGWEWRPVLLPGDRYWGQILVGSSTARVDDGYLYAWSGGAAVGGGNPVYLARWPVDTAARGDLGRPQWYRGGGWHPQSFETDEFPTALVNDGNNEVYVAPGLWPGKDATWWWFQSQSVLNSPLCYRSSADPRNPGQCVPFYTPPELAAHPGKSLLVYAIKGHPALSGASEGEVIATYVVNSCDLRDIQQSCELYYPRFLKLRLKPEL